MSTPTTAEAAVKALFTAAAEEDAAYGQLLGRLCTLRSTQESEGGWERDVQLGAQLDTIRREADRLATAASQVRVELSQLLLAVAEALLDARGGRDDVAA